MDFFRIPSLTDQKIHHVVQKITNHRSRRPKYDRILSIETSIITRVSMNIIGL